MSLCTCLRWPPPPPCTRHPTKLSKNVSERFGGGSSRRQIELWSRQESVKVCPSLLIWPQELTPSHRNLHAFPSYLLQTFTPHSTSLWPLSRICRICSKTQLLSIEAPNHTMLTLAVKKENTRSNTIKSSGTNLTHLFWSVYLQAGIHQDISCCISTLPFVQREA